jgi:hypothetical protein
MLCIDFIFDPDPTYQKFSDLYPDLYQTKEKSRIHFRIRNLGSA